jgi:hypothetical protein
MVQQLFTKIVFLPHMGEGGGVECDHGKSPLVIHDAQFLLISSVCPVTKENRK